MRWGSQHRQCHPHGSRNTMPFVSHLSTASCSLLAPSHAYYGTPSIHALCPPICYFSLITQVSGSLLAFLCLSFTAHSIVAHAAWCFSLPLLVAVSIPPRLFTTSHLLPTFSPPLTCYPAHFSLLLPTAATALTSATLTPKRDMSSRTWS